MKKCGVIFCRHVHCQCLFCWLVFSRVWLNANIWWAVNKTQLRLMGMFLVLQVFGHKHIWHIKMLKSAAIHFRADWTDCFWGSSVSPQAVWGGFRGEIPTLPSCNTVTSWVTRGATQWQCHPSSPFKTHPTLRARKSLARKETGNRHD